MISHAPGLNLTVVRRLLQVLDDDRAAGLVEWALLVLLIAVVALVAVRIGGNELSSSYSEIASSLANA